MSEPGVSVGEESSTLEAQASDPRVGLTVVHRRYVPYSHAH